MGGVGWVLILLLLCSPSPLLYPLSHLSSTPPRPPPLIPPWPFAICLSQHTQDSAITMLQERGLLRLVLHDLVAYKQEASLAADAIMAGGEGGSAAATPATSPLGGSGGAGGGGGGGGGESKTDGGDDGGGGGDEEGGAAEDALNNMVVEGQGRSHILQVATRLEFLHFALSRASALCLDLDAVNALWDSVHDDALTIKERNLLLKWLQVACRMQSRGHTFMEDGVALELFRQKMTRSDGDRAAYWEEMSEEGFACLESFFLLVNERSGQLYQEGGGSGGKVHVRVLPEKLEGMLSLWRVALEAANSTLGYVRLR